MFEIVLHSQQEKEIKNILTLPKKTKLIYMVASLLVFAMEFGISRIQQQEKN